MAIAVHAHGVGINFVCDRAAVMSRRTLHCASERQQEASAIAYLSH
jgi:hypothetical protein